MIRCIPHVACDNSKRVSVGILCPMIGVTGPVALRVQSSLELIVDSSGKQFSHGVKWSRLKVAELRHGDSLGSQKKGNISHL
jgi:hypothetical protein